MLLIESTDLALVAGHLMYSQLSPCGHPAITDTRYYGQNSDPHL